MKIEDLHKLKLGDMLICTQTIGDIQKGQIFYFITYYNRRGVKPTLYLSKVPINSNANPSDSYEPEIIEYFETANKLREEKINIILE
jgi:hypothetical protein